MRWHPGALLAGGLLLLAGCGSRHGAAYDRAVETANRLNGEMQQDPDRPGKPVVRLLLGNTGATDRDVEKLRGFKDLEALYLSRTQVTDDGLRHLSAFPNLHTLSLRQTQVTDRGLEHLKGLSNLRELYLDGTGITDAGLEHLKGLTKLRTLHLADGHRVTEAGIQELQKALTELQVRR